MKECHDSCGPSEAGLTASYSTIRPHGNRQPRPGIAALDLTSPSKYPSQSERPATTSAAFPSTSFAAAIDSPTPRSAQRSPLPQRVIDAYPHLAGKTREEAWRHEVTEWNSWLEAVRNWIQGVQETIREPVENSVSPEHAYMVATLLATIEDFLSKFPRFQNQLNAAQACIDYDQQKQQDQLREFCKIFKIPSFCPPTLPAPVAPSDAQLHAASDLTGSGTAAKRQPSAGTNRDMELFALLESTLNNNEARGGPDSQRTPNMKSIGPPDEGFCSKTGRGGTTPGEVQGRVALGAYAPPNTIGQPVPENPDSDGNNGTDLESTPGASRVGTSNTSGGTDVGNANRRPMTTATNHQARPNTIVPSIHSGGGSSLSEAKSSSTPMDCFPLFTPQPRESYNPNANYYMDRPNPPPSINLNPGQGLASLKTTTAASSQPPSSPTSTVVPNKGPSSEVRLADPNNPDQPFLVRSSDGVVTSRSEIIQPGGWRKLTPSPGLGNQVQGQPSLGDDQQQQQPPAQESKSQEEGATQWSPGPSQDQNPSAG
ncbi:hypothetical protein V8F33_012143 [Rhypophila sp. PSN 637]